MSLRAVLLAAKDDGGSAGMTAMTSQDGGVTWTDRNTGLPNSGFACAYGAGLFVVGAQHTSTTEQISTSPDGEHWTLRSSPADNAVIWKIIFAGGQFVAMWGNFPNVTHVMTSPDAINWTNHTIPTTAQWRDLTYSPSLGMYAAIRAGGVMTSTDGGSTWTDQTVPITFNDAACIAWGAGLFAAMGGTVGSGSNHLHTSTDGVTWTHQSDPAGVPDRWEAVAFGGGKFVAVSSTGASTHRAVYSSDGLTWTQASGVPDESWQSVAYAAGTFFSAANDPASTNAIMTSADGGATWTSQTTPAADFSVAVAYGVVNVIGPTFVAARQAILDYGPFERTDHSLLTVLFGNSPVDTQAYEAPTRAGTSWSAFSALLTGSPDAEPFDQSYSLPTHKLAIAVGDGTTANVATLYEIDSITGSQSSSTVPTTVFGSVGQPFSTLGICACADGSTLVYGNPDSDTTTMQFIRRKAGAWGSNVTFATVGADGGIIVASCSNSTGTAYLIWAKLSGAPPQTWTVYMSVVRPDDSFDAPVVVATGFTTDDTFFSWLKNWGPDVTLGCSESEIFVALANEGVYHSALASPSFSLSLATPGGFLGADPTTQPNIIFDSTNGRVYAVYNVLTFDMSFNVVADGMWVRNYQGSGTWGPATLGVDFLAAPPSGATPGSTNSDRNSTHILSDGTFGTLSRFGGGGVTAGTYYTQWSNPIGSPVNVCGGGTAVGNCWDSCFTQLAGNVFA